MKVKFLKNIGVFIKGQEVEMKLARAEQYVNGGYAEPLLNVPQPKAEEPVEEEPKQKAKAKAKPKAKKE